MPEGAQQEPKHGPEARNAVESEAELPLTKYEQEIAWGLEVGLPAADSVVETFGNAATTTWQSSGHRSTGAPRAAPAPVSARRASARYPHFTALTALSWALTCANPLRCATWVISSS